MKLKKVTIITLIAILLISQFSFLAIFNSAYAVETTTASFTADITANKSTVVKGNEFTVTFKIKDLTNVGNGLLALGGFLKFDKNVLEIKNGGIKQLGTWVFSADYYNLENFKFIADSTSAVKSNVSVFQITFRVKANAPVGQTNIILESVQGSTGDVIATANNKTLSINIQDEPESITSTVYNIGTDTISVIAPDTTITQFKNNVTTKQNIVFKTASGTVITDNNTVVSTGMKIEVGNTLRFTAIVTGDIDGDGTIGVNDIAQIKLHYIEKTLLTGIYLQAADLDYNNSIDINDVGKLKLEYIKKQ